jgi:hypothetical protein
LAKQLSLSVKLYCNQKLLFFVLTPSIKNQTENNFSFFDNNNFGINAKGRGIGRGRD